MKLSWLGMSTVGLVFLTILLRLVNVGRPWVMMFGPLIVMIILVIVAAIVMAATKRRGSDEIRVWTTFLIAAILNTIGGLIEVFVNISKITGSTLDMIGSFFFIAAYIGFILGMIIANIQFRSLRKVNLIIPGVVVFLILGVSLFFQFKFMHDGNVGQINQVIYTVFMVLDAALVLLSWVLAVRTSGGSMSFSYLLISLGCIGLAFFHAIAVNFQMLGIWSIDSYIRLVFVVVLALIAVGGDVRIMIENKIRV